MLISQRAPSIVFSFFSFFSFVYVAVCMYMTLLILEALQVSHKAVKVICKGKRAELVVASNN